MKHILEDYLKKEMDRKEFLRQIGFLMMAVFGISSVLKYLAEQAGSNMQRRTTDGYGSHSYGGKDKTPRRPIS